MRLNSDEIIAPVVGYAEAQVEVEKPFAQEAELVEKIERLRILNAELNMDERETSLIDGEPDETQPDPPQRKGGAR